MLIYETRLQIENRKIWSKAISSSNVWKKRSRHILKRPDLNEKGKTTTGIEVTKIDYLNFYWLDYLSVVYFKKLIFSVLKNIVTNLKRFSGKMITFSVSVKKLALALLTRQSNEERRKQRRASKRKKYSLEELCECEWLDRIENIVDLKTHVTI